MTDSTCLTEALGHSLRGTGPEKVPQPALGLYAIPSLAHLCCDVLELWRTVPESSSLPSSPFLLQEQKAQRLGQEE